MKQELNIEPNSQTISLYEEILLLPNNIDKKLVEETNSIRVHVPAGLRTPFKDFGRIPLVGRENERKQILSTIDQLRFEKGGIYLIEGEPGIGKTRLVENIAASVEWRGMQAYWVTCNAEPFNPLIDSGVTHLKRVAPGIGGGGFAPTPYSRRHSPRTA